MVVKRPVPHLESGTGSSKVTIRIALCGISKSWREKNPRDLTKYGHLINTKATTKPDIDAFLTKHPEPNSGNGNNGDEKCEHGEDTGGPAKLREGNQVGSDKSGHSGEGVEDEAGGGGGYGEENNGGFIEGTSNDTEASSVSSGEGLCLVLSPPAGFALHDARQSIEGCTNAASAGFECRLYHSSVALADIPIDPQLQDGCTHNNTNQSGFGILLCIAVDKDATSSQCVSPFAGAPPLAPNPISSNQPPALAAYLPGASYSLPKFQMPPPPLLDNHLIASASKSSVDSALPKKHGRPPKIPQPDTTEPSATPIRGGPAEALAIANELQTSKHAKRGRPPGSKNKPK
ncbi:hypothetical protein BDV93DRAFT_511868 [Ceratobasidium sp. AG-I]|nr:hypothetical protein BDV93DRAFT_511868 [Ceratobasidium sp. AG-I]